MKRSIVIGLFFFLLIPVCMHAQPRQGQPAAEIALPDVHGDTLKLSSLKGKVVLLDFWASWCGPCRMANKHLAKLYKKFGDKGFEIYSVSLDADKKKWLRAIQQDKITWQQVNDGGGWEANVARAWDIYALPTSYLIDRDGRLLAMDLMGKPLEDALKQLIDK